MPSKKPADPATELEVLFPENYFESSNGKIEVKSFAFGQWRKVIKIYNQHSGIFTGGEQVAAILLAEDGSALEDLAELCLMACPSLNRETLDSLPGDEAVSLFFKVFAVNADFFLRATRTGSELVVKAFQSKEAESAEAGEK
jgi:hypothetical protein